MASYYDRDDDTERGRRRFTRDEDSYRGTQEFDRGRRDFDSRFRDERDRGWEVGRENASRYGTGWPEDYERGYSSRYFTGDEQGRGFAGGRDFGRSYTPSYDRGYGSATRGNGGYSRSYARGDSTEHDAERHYEGTYRPPDYGRNFARTHRGEGYAGDRDWLDRASDEVASWFGDDNAERRRRLDKMQEGNFRGRGPKGYRRSDERIREDVNDRLTDHAHLDASDIDVTVKEAEVALSGKVNDRADKRIAEAIAESVSGVKNVQNNLKVNDNWQSAATTQATPRAV